MRKIIYAGVALLAACAQAGAVTLNVEQGVVKLNQGKGFHPVEGTVDVRVGDLVKVEANAKASLVAGDGSAANLKPGLTRVLDRSFMARATQPAPAAEPSDAAFGDVNPLYVIGGLAVIGGAVGGAVAATSSGGDSNNDAAALLLAASRPAPVSR